MYKRSILWSITQYWVLYNLIYTNNTWRCKCYISWIMLTNAVVMKFSTTDYGQSWIRQILFLQTSKIFVGKNITRFCKKMLVIIYWLCMIIGRLHDFVLSQQLREYYNCLSLFSYRSICQACFIIIESRTKTFYMNLTIYIKARWP